ncbi:uncharacterized protein LOC124271053 [Haliotis rubra]|uniref:uncharacterized protein LOC124271053 n=1 Tax=Haliotis rubra TaxID=36100 RepID=UPI001EE52412|nr:uncharacterized protein LOC124271053 [Haliotis rubra]XP_046562082.1 uncharacterized protein LOC124271053 [Haliotis rubra]
MDNVIKQGYLRKAFPSERGLSNLLDKIDPNKWFVFLVRQGKPYLEYYEKETDVFSAEPINTFDLSSCKQVTFTFLRNARIHTFNIILGDRVIELATTSREIMISWCDCLEITLQRLGILGKEDHEHVYSFCPAVVNKIGHSSKDEEEDSKEEEGAAADYSVPDEDIFGTVREMEKAEETDKKMTEKDIHDYLLRKESNASHASEDDTSDYSGDFVGREFFQKNRILLGEKKRDSLGRSAVVKSDRTSVANIETQPKTVEDSNNNTNSFGSGDNCIDDLDDGYSELANWRMKDAKFGEGGHNGMAVSKNPSPPNQKTTASSHIKNQGSLSDGISKEKLVVDLPQEACCSNDSGCRPLVGGTTSAAAAQNSGLRGGGAQNANAVSNMNQRGENLYSAFPGAEEQVFSETLTTQTETSLKSVEPLPRSVAPSTKPIPRRRTHVPNSKSVDHGTTKMFQKWETFDSDFPSKRAPNTPAASATRDSMSNGTSNIPPLPPRFDSLPSWCSDSTDDTLFKNIQERPMPRVPSPVFNHMTQSYTGPSVSSQQVPPIPPRRDSRGNRAASTSDIAPPLPARRSQSFRIQRPITSPPNLTGDGPQFLDHPPPSPQDIDDAVVRRPDRQLSIRMRMERGQSAHTVISLKHNQIDILQGEMLSAGVALELTQKSCQGIALVDINKKVWIGGWNWKDFPRLHSKFHVGDELLSINSQPVENASSAMKILKHASKPMEVVVRRIPNARVFEIRRSAEGQSLGIRREGGTGEILYVDPNGLAAKHGLLSRGECVLNPGNLCTWYMTEINSRPVSLYFKDLEIEHRLNAVGLEISFVVQPSDFINEIKKQIKKMKNYKSYIPQ